MLVVSWRTMGAKRVPYIAFELDAALLRLVDRDQLRYRYEGALFPRRRTRQSAANDHTARFHEHALRERLAAGMSGE